MRWWCLCVCVCVRTCWCVCCSVLLQVDSSVSLLRRFVNLVSGKRRVWTDKVRQGWKQSHTLSQGLCCTFPTRVYTHTQTHIQKITWITAYPMFIKCFQGECQASCLCLCECGAAPHTGRFLLSSCVFSMGCFYRRLMVSQLDASTQT